MNLIKKTALLSVIALGLAAIPATAQGLLLQAGIGAAFPEYSGVANGLDDYLDAFDGRLSIALDLQVGFALTPQGYLMAGIYGIGDRGTTGADYAQYNSYLYFLGFRAYPLERGLYLQAMGGLGDMSETDNDSLTDDYNAEGSLGWGAAIGYDFAPSGLGLALELAYISANYSSDMGWGDEDGRTSAWNFTANLSYR